MFDVDRDLAKAEAIDAAVGQFTANDPDLSAFKKRGGKLLQYHGWNDEQISPQNSVNYYKSVVSRIGQAEEVATFYRLFMVPGMMHCRGGTGATTSGVNDRTRPLCPYPQVARWNRSGSTDDAANFACVQGAQR